MGVLNRSNVLFLHSSFTSALLTQVLTSSMSCNACIGMWSVDVELTMYYKKEIYSSCGKDLDAILEP